MWWRFMKPNPDLIFLYKIQCQKTTIAKNNIMVTDREKNRPLEIHYLRFIYFVFSLSFAQRPKKKKHIRKMIRASR